MTDLRTELRRAVVPALKGNAALVGVSAGSIHTARVPANASWPIVHWGVATTVPLEATCLSGETIRVTIHAYAGPRVEGGQEVETGEDQIGRIAGGIKQVLHRRRLVIPSGQAMLRWINATTLRDGSEADDWHAICEFRARVMAS